MVDTIVKFVRDDQKTFTVSRTGDWRFLKKGLNDYGAFNVDLNYIDNATADGGMITSSRMTKVDRTLSCAYILPSNNVNARKEATAFFNASACYKVYVTYGDRTRWAEGKLLKLEMPTTPDITDLLKLTVTLEYPNPYWNSYDDFGKDIASVTPTTAFPYLCQKGVGRPTGKYNFAKMVIMENDGDVDTYCRAEFLAKGDVLNPKLIIGEYYVRVLDSLVDGDVILMDFTASPPSIKKNGVNIMGKCDRTSAFDSMILALGDTAVEYDADNGSDQLAVSIYFNKLYCSI